MSSGSPPSKPVVSKAGMFIIGALVVLVLALPKITQLLFGGID